VRPSGVVTLLTDFGLDDPYVGIVKGVILGIFPEARLVDLTHRIPPQDIRRGALALEAAYRAFPRGTVHLAVVDPGVGGPRRAVALRADGHYFVGPDNGLLGFLLDRPGVVAVTLTRPAFHRPAPSRTFHARDLFAPVAAYCARGVPLERLGPPARGLTRLTWPRARRGRAGVRGEVLLADAFGNLLTSVTVADLPASPAECVVEIAGQRIVGVAGTYGERPPGGLGAVIDSSGRLEIFVREGSARERLGLSAGTPVRVSGASRSGRRAGGPAGAGPTRAGPAGAGPARARRSRRARGSGRTRPRRPGRP
jgi:S-adenosylmethionine hydrolase